MAGTAMAEPSELLERVLRARGTVTWDYDLHKQCVTYQSALRGFPAPAIASPLPLARALRFIFPADRHEFLIHLRRASTQRTPFVHHARIVLNPKQAPVWVENHG